MSSTECGFCCFETEVSEYNNPVTGIGDMMLCEVCAGSIKDTLFITNPTLVAQVAWCTNYIVKVIHEH